MPQSHLCHKMTLSARTSMDYYSIVPKIVPQKIQETPVIFLTNFRRVSCTFCMLIFTYSFLIAANGLNFMARSDGKKPASIPTRIANTRDKTASQSGIYEIPPLKPI